jgi:hypothetical protein
MMLYTKRLSNFQIVRQTQKPKTTAEQTTSLGIQIKRRTAGERVQLRILKRNYHTWGNN